MKFHLPFARLSLVLLCSWTVAAAAQTLTPDQEVLARYPWANTANTVPPDWGEHRQLVDPSTGVGGKMLKITNPGPVPLTVTVLTIPKPPITSDFYTLRAQVRWEDVAGDGYLEMWSDFPGGGHYFTRTVNDSTSDPVGKLSGTGDWRLILLPFNSQGCNGRPESLTVNVVLPGKGTVYLTEMQLVQVRPGPTPDPAAKPTPTPAASSPGGGGFSGRGTLESWGGLGVGLLAGSMIALDALARRESHRVFVLVATWTLAALGFAVLVAGANAWQCGLPPVIWATRLAAGVFISLACGWNALRFRRQYRHAEWRRMAALDG